jgi:hypothetical protein
MATSRRGTREAVRTALDDYQATLKRELDQTPRGSGHAPNAYDHLQASITQVKSAKRVLFMEN